MRDTRGNGSSAGTKLSRQQYELISARERQAREAAESQERSQEQGPPGLLHDFQAGPKIARPNALETLIPVIGPGWEAAADLQDGDYRGAALNVGLAALDVVPAAVALKGVNAARKGIGIWKAGSITANAAAKQMRARGLAKAGQEIHHSAALNGASRTAQDWRNHFAFLKPLPKVQHRRLHGSWGGLPRYDPIRRVWYGTTDWQKALPLGVADHVASAWDNLARPFAQSDDDK